MYTLYLKTHNVTGLKYLGYTKRKDVQKYTGSGVYWLRHIKKYGYDVTTNVLGVYETENELKHYGLFYSNKFNVISNKAFANLKEEAGVSGKYSDETKEKMSIKALNRVKTIGAPKTAWTSESMTALNAITWANPETRKARSIGISKALTGKVYGPRTEDFKKHMSKVLTGRSYGKGIKHNLVEKTCPHCQKVGNGPNMTRYHFNNCKIQKRTN
jgi:hypothetical protein